MALAPGAPLGSTPNSLALSADQKTLLVASADNNALAVIHGRYGTALPGGRWYDVFVGIKEGSLRYGWPTLAICIGLVAPILVWLFLPLCARASSEDQKSDLEAPHPRDNGDNHRAAPRRELVGHDSP